MATAAAAIPLIAAAITLAVSLRRQFYWDVVGDASARDACLITEPLYLPHPPPTQTWLIDDSSCDGGVGLLQLHPSDPGDPAVLALGAGALLAIVLVGATTWFTVGRVIRPVEAIRRQVAEVSTQNLGHRVPVPRTRTEITRLAETMNDTLARLEHAVTEQQRFVADASHELRGPIAALRSELEIALTHPERAHWPQVVAGALEDTERLQQLATDLLLLSRLDAAPPEPDETVDLVALAREQGALRRLPRRLTLHYDLDPGEVTVEGRSALLARLVRNLLDNAERYATSSITIRVAVEESAALLEVSDDGPGIPPADRERVFDRFTRLDQARARDTGGVGLGLAIARHIAMIHRGTLRVADSDHGARFTFTVTTASWTSSA